jgi:hypothetical protein
MFSSAGCGDTSGKGGHVSCGRFNGAYVGTT